MIHVKDLSFAYRKKKPLFNQLQLSLEPGKVYGLLGKNGAGKTTLIKHITGLLMSRTGKCIIMGEEAKKRAPGVLQEIFFLPEEFSLPALSMEDFVDLHAPFYPRFSQTILDRCLKEFEMARGEKLHTLSYGQKKKFLIAFGLATDTRIMVMDEPTNGLDIPSKSQFRKIMTSVIDQGRLVLISTHQVRDLSSLIDHVIILDHGIVVFSQDTPEISNRLSFGRQKDHSKGTPLYSEPILGGKACVFPHLGQETEIDLELLFNAIIKDPGLINEQFN
jgi:ABC-2 type transport system ATP-binding protein